MPEAVWPMVGRDDELAAIRRSLRSRRHVALDGVAGVGTTRLAAESVDRAAPGRRVHRLVGSPSEMAVPLAALHPLLAGRSVEDMFPALVQALGDDALVLVDDAHHLDDASATVLHQLVISGTAEVVLTLRTGAALPGPVVRILREATVDRIDVPPLGTSEVHDLLRRQLTGPVDGRTLHRLGLLSGGRPLYLHELIAGARASGGLVHDGLVTRLEGEVALTPTLEAVLAERLGDLDTREHEALELVAIAGGLDLDVAGVVVDTAALDQLERRGLVRVVDTDSGAMAEIAQALDAEVLAQRVGRVGRRQQSRRLADAADAVGYAERGPAAARHAVTWALRGGLAPDGLALAAATRHAADSGEAAQGAELALAAFAKLQDAPSALLGAWCFAREGDHGAGLDLLTRALGVVDDPWERAAVAHQAAEEHWWWHGDLEAARVLVDPASLPPGPWRELLVAQGAMFDYLDGSIASGLAAVDRLVGVDEGNSRFVAELARGLALALSDQGDAAVLVSQQAQAAAAAVEAVDRDLLGNPDFHVLSAVLGLLYSGRLVEATDVADLVYEVAVAQAEPHAQAWAALFVGAVGLLRGDTELARERLAEAEATFLECSLQGLARWATALSALAAFERGDARAGDAALARLQQYAPEGFRLYEPIVALAEAWSAALDGRRGDATILATGAAEAAVAAGAWSHVAQIAHDLGRMGVWVEAVAFIDRLPTPASAFTDARRAFLYAGAAEDGNGLDQAVQSFEDLGAMLFAAESAALASVAHQRAGRKRPATASSARMAALLNACPGAATPALTQSGPGVDLSSREQEVSAMAAVGRSNREIADQLGLSERTVENHLYRAFAKLGIRGRLELAPALDARARLVGDPPGSD